jgi:NADPH:quinone reductase-like Zn-dependent oxidoreductase
MTKLHRQSLIAYGQPLCETVVDCPVPRGSEVLVRVERCGVCHSDLHLQDGYFLLGGDKKLDVSAGRNLPFTLGHEIAGVVETAGAGVDPGMIGRRVAVYPGLAAVIAPPASVARRTSAPPLVISASALMAASLRMCSFRIRVISWTTLRSRRPLPQRSCAPD